MPVEKLMLEHFGARTARTEKMGQIVLKECGPLRQLLSHDREQSRAPEIMAKPDSSICFHP